MRSHRYPGDGWGPGAGTGTRPDGGDGGGVDGGRDDGDGVDGGRDDGGGVDGGRDDGDAGVPSAELSLVDVRGAVGVTAVAPSRSGGLAFGRARGAGALRVRGGSGAVVGPGFPAAVTS
jgi:hypothetical protein